jgi:hypothetical protein
LNYEYDVAISFLAKDHGTAVAIRELLAPSLRVFEFSSRQEEVAGTDGLVTFRHVFNTAARLVVVLHRAGWGQSPWTRVEEIAIQERFLHDGPSFLLFVMLESGQQAPPWVPENRIRLSFEQYGLEQTVGAIRLRVEELGGSVAKETIAELARRAAEAHRYAAETAGLRNDSRGVEQVQSEALEMFRLIEAHLSEAASAAPSFRLQWARAELAFGANSPKASVDINLHIAYVNALRDSFLLVREIEGAFSLPGKRTAYRVEPTILAEDRYDPDRAIGIGWGWRRGQKLWSSADIADRTVRRLLGRIAKYSGMD